MAARNTFLLVPLIIDVLTGLLLALAKGKILYQTAIKRLLFINLIANTSLLSINSVKQSLAQTLEARDKPLPYVGQSLVDCRRASRSRLGLGTGRAGRYAQTRPLPSSE